MSLRFEAVARNWFAWEIALFSYNTSGLDNNTL
ncbi:hypothetical protein FKM82_007836 [Ascaphus truei]